MIQNVFYMPTRIVSGKGSILQIGNYIKGNRVLIICDPFLYQNGVAEKIGDNLKGCQVAYFHSIEPNPSCESVDAAAAIAREMDAETIVGIGGGSSMDVSKIVACLAREEGSIYEFYGKGTRVLKEREVGLICVPTTAGTGSEVTNVGVYTNSVTHIKMPFVNNRFWPDVALLDPELTYSLPQAVTASTGMDAFCHAIEAYWNKESQPISDAIAIYAMRLILDNIKAAYDDGNNVEARENMQLASLMAGVAFSQTRTTGIHAISFPLTTEFGASHGIACAITLPAFMRKVNEGAKDKMDKLCASLGYVDLAQFSYCIEELMKSMNMPVRLGQLGVKMEDLDHITEIGLSAAIIQLTPATMNHQSVYNLLESII